MFSSPLTTFALWSLLGFGASLAAVAVAFKTEQIRQEWRVLQTSKLTYFSLFATTGLMQFCTIVALGQFQVGYALALFQISSLVSVALGHRFFQERRFARRLTGSLVMAAGAALIIVAQERSTARSPSGENSPARVAVRHLADSANSGIGASCGLCAPCDRRRPPLSRVDARLSF